MAKATTIYKMASEEYTFNRYIRAKMLNALAYVVEAAEDEANADVYFTYTDIGHGPMKKGIIIHDIGALSGMSDKLGNDFMPENILRGIAEATQDQYDGYHLKLLTTHDFYSATIEDLSNLLYAIRLIEA